MFSPSTTALPRTYSCIKSFRYSSPSPNDSTIRWQLTRLATIPKAAIKRMKVGEKVICGTHLKPRFGDAANVKHQQGRVNRSVEIDAGSAPPYHTSSPANRSLRVDPNVHASRDFSF